MPDLVKSIPIMLDKPRRLRFDFNAMATFQDQTGINPLLIGDRISEPKNLRALLWVCLQDEDPGITLETVGHMMGISNHEMIEGKLAEAFSKSLPKEKEGGKKIPPRPGRWTSRISGLLRSFFSGSRRHGSGG